MTTNLEIAEFIRMNSLYNANVIFCLQVALLSPYQSMLYTWDDPSKERSLLWNVYNKKSKGFFAEFWKVRALIDICMNCYNKYYIDIKYLSYINSSGINL